MQQAAERQQLDERRAACFERLQYESCLIRNQLQASALVDQSHSNIVKCMYVCDVSLMISVCYKRLG